METSFVVLRMETIF